ncbi:hypothetical protein CLOM_g1803 [Closterium sp. NIES-68]|nr:hypothetical protein CLOM_g1803 [Closterium sp. NIES-68]GJP75183.1 hypothetical protein CLOP_g5658 [Closterium sp. NIES-67]GJP83916.1 hypothetical protein CLOP_g14017 [Closterium sp. NIES-67]
MTFAAFSGAFLIGFGPAIAVIAITVSRQAFLSLVTLTSTFYWLITLLSIAFLWRPFIALTSLSDFFLLLLILSAVACQELSRQLLCQILNRLEQGLNVIATSRQLPPLSPLNTFHLSLATGLGHGIAHSVFLFLSVSSPAIGPATFYSWRCPQLPLVLLAAIASAAFLIVHSLGMVLAYDAHKVQLIKGTGPSTGHQSIRGAQEAQETKPLRDSQPTGEAPTRQETSLAMEWRFSLPSSPQEMCAPALHAATAVSMLMGLFTGGCVTAVVLSWLCALASIVVVALLVHARGDRGVH